MAVELEKVTKSVGKNARNAVQKASNGDGSLTRPAGLAVAGAALAAAPFVAEKLAGRGGSKIADKASNAAEMAKSKAASQVRETAKEAMPDSPTKMLGGAGPLKKIFGGNGSADAESNGDGRAAPGFGSGRRMPIQQSIDVAVPVKAAYNHWAQFEDWPEFMHRVESVEQVDDATVSFQAKIWGISKRFEADIVEQRPDKRIEWNVTEGYAHTGVVTFHPLSSDLTRIDLTVDVQPSNLIDKMSRGMRFVKRAVRGDLHRFKAYVELDHEDVKGWRGTIEDGKLKRKPGSGKS
jgi:uncharacterized membrane protein